MNTRNLISLVILALGTVLLPGCASTYLHAPVPPGEAHNSARFDGTWAGETHPRYRMRMVNSAKTMGKAIICEPYHDRVTIAVHQGLSTIEVGSAPTYRLTASLDDAGRFYQSIPLKTGRNSGYHDRSTELSVTGKLDPDSGHAQGWIAITPSGLFYGCLGTFQAQRNGVALPTSSISIPFTTDYHFENAIERN